MNELQKTSNSKRFDSWIWLIYGVDMLGENLIILKKKNKAEARTLIIMYFWFFTSYIV